MAACAFHLSLADGMMRLLGNLYSQVTVTGKAQIRLGSLKIHLLSGMDGVATVAGNTRRLVLPQIPVGEAA